MNTELLATADRLEDWAKNFNEYHTGDCDLAARVLHFVADPRGDASRAAFEAFALRYGLALERSGVGRYTGAYTYRAWRAWQAALEAAAKGGEA